MKDQSQSNHPNHLISLQSAYLEAMCHGSGRAADKVLQQALDVNTAADDIYLSIFQPTAYAIGRLWQSNRFSVAQEHLATAIIERQMGEMHPLFRPQQHRTRTIVIGCVPNEQHRVGARMVADFFEEDGWDVHYLGAAVPILSFVGIVKELQADLIGISAQMVYHLPAITEFARSLDMHGLSHIPVMVGGMPFIEQPELTGTLNVRYSAADARKAVHVANQLFSQPHRITQSTRPQLATSEETIAIFRKARLWIINASVERSLEHSHELTRLGDQPEQVLMGGFEFMSRMLETAMLLQNTALLDEQLIWGNQRQPHDGVDPAHILHRFKLYAEVVDEILPSPHARVVNQYVSWLITRQQELVDQIETNKSENAFTTET